MRVTFDSNVWVSIARPSTEPALAKIRQAIIDKKVTAFLSETVFTLEAIKKGDRSSFFALYKPKIDVSETPQGDGTMKISICMGSNATHHPGNTGILSSVLQDALSIGFKLLRCPRISGVKNPDIQESYFLSNDYVAAAARQTAFAAVGREIEDMGAGISHIKAIGMKYNLGNWVAGIRMSPASENQQIAKAVAEWADGDSLAAHIAYKNDYFCTRDVGKSGGNKSVLSSQNRVWLSQKHGVVFVTPKELADSIV